MNKLKNRLYPAYKILRKYPLWGKYLKWYFYSNWQPNKPFEVNLDGAELRITLTANDALAPSIFWRGKSEPIFFDFMSKYLKPGMTVFDIGANIGQYTLLASQCVGQNGRVHSFEPADREFSFLQRSIKNNELANIFLQKKAVSNFDGYAPLNIFPDGQGAYNTLGKPSHNVVAQIKADIKEVECVQIDTYVRQSQINNVDLIKIDVEGGEINVLEGAKDLLSREDAPLVMCEFGDETLAGFGNTGRELHECFERLGYQVMEPSEHGDFLTLVEKRGRYGANYIAIKPHALKRWGLTLAPN
ncbi:MAG: FkbM family methyltransferase [Anaerolineales bacterium]|nr:FkbM family methyltransferase [Anaerolineales bacterium]